MLAGRATFEIFELPRDETQITHEEPGRLKVLEDEGTKPSPRTRNSCEPSY